MYSMAIFVNVCVACTNKTTILPWSIVSANDREHSFWDFYISCIQQHIPLTQEVTFLIRTAYLCFKYLVTTYVKLFVVMNNE